MKGAKEKYVYAMGVGYSMVAIDYISRKCVRDGYRLIYTESLGELSEFKDNVGIMVSESGETQLVIDEAEKCRQHGYFTIAFLRNGNSRLRKMVDLPVIIPKEEWRMNCRLIRLYLIPSLHFNYCFPNYEVLKYNTDVAV